MRPQSSDTKHSRYGRNLASPGPQSHIRLFLRSGNFEFARKNQSESNTESPVHVEDSALPSRLITAPNGSTATPSAFPHPYDSKPIYDTSPIHSSSELRSTHMLQPQLVTKATKAPIHVCRYRLQSLVTSLLLRQSDKEGVILHKEDGV